MISNDKNSIKLVIEACYLDVTFELKSNVLDSLVWAKLIHDQIMGI